MGRRGIELLIGLSACLVWRPPAIAGPIEPALEGRDDIVVWSDFEEDDWADDWTEASHPENHAATEEAAFGGTRSLRVSALAGEHYGGALEYRFAEEGDEEPDELYFRYYVNISATWELDGEGEIGKLPGFGGTYGVAGWGGRPADGTNGWSARMMNWDQGDLARVGFYVYHADMQGTYGDHEPWMPDLPRDTWICIEAHVVMNTITDGVGNMDGVLEGWIDEEPAFSNTTMRFRHVDTLSIEKVWANVYVGGDWTADHDMHLYFDNMVVAYNRIGCFAEADNETSGGTTSTDPGTTEAGEDTSTSSPPEGTTSTSTPTTTASTPTSIGYDPPTDATESEGCGCTSTSPPRLALLWPLLLLALRRRRRRGGPRQFG